MASLLESGAIRDAVKRAFQGRLRDGTLRREVSTTVDSGGNPVVSSADTYSFEGIRDTFNAFYAAQAGIPVTDVRVLIIAGSLSVVPQKGDHILIQDQWHEVRELLERDPADATHVLQCFEILDPT